MQDKKEKELEYQEDSRKYNSKKSSKFIDYKKADNCDRRDYWQD